MIIISARIFIWKLSKKCNGYLLIVIVHEIVGYISGESEDRRVQWLRDCLILDELDVNSPSFNVNPEWVCVREPLVTVSGNLRYAVAIPMVCKMACFG